MKSTPLKETASETSAGGVADDEQVMVSLFTTTAGTWLVPKRHVGTWWLEKLDNGKLEPVMVSSVPPLAGPYCGVNADTTAGR